ncbi:MAG: hypothetical protein E5W95_31280 [Mesorhizobium sp.]|nr:MAG: hypothetical protein E5W95_31280 [Mesorhizobium sp.]
MQGRGGSAPFLHQAKELRPAPAGRLLTGKCAARGNCTKSGNPKQAASKSAPIQPLAPYSAVGGALASGFAAELHHLWGQDPALVVKTYRLVPVINGCLGWRSRIAVIDLNG